MRWDGGGDWAGAERDGEAESVEDEAEVGLVAVAIGLKGRAHAALSDDRWPIGTAGTTEILSAGRSRRAYSQRRPGRATMLADLDPAADRRVRHRRRSP